MGCFVLVLFIWFGLVFDWLCCKCLGCSRLVCFVIVGLGGACI